MILGFLASCIFKIVGLLIKFVPQYNVGLYLNKHIMIKINFLHKECIRKLRKDFN